MGKLSSSNHFLEFTINTEEEQDVKMLCKTGKSPFVSILDLLIKFINFQNIRHDKLYSLYEKDKLQRTKDDSRKYT